MRQFAVARHIGRKDYDGAIRLLEESVLRNPNDAESFQLIALCHLWAQRQEESIAAAERALACDAGNFIVLRMLSKTHARRSEHDLAAKYARLGLENYPEPLLELPPQPEQMLRLYRWALATFAFVRRFVDHFKKLLTDYEDSNKRWYDWAMQYLAWYDASHGGKEKPTVH